jgi:hypothetical protein
LLSCTSVCTEEGLKRIGADRKRCIKVSASVIRGFTHRRRDAPEKHVRRLAVLQACEIAGLGPEDVVEVQDASAMGQIIQAENLELVPLGGGGPARNPGKRRRVAGCRESGGRGSHPQPLGPGAKRVGLGRYRSR